MRCHRRPEAAAILVSAVSLLCACMGTFETARVVPLRMGAHYFRSISGDGGVSMPGLFIEGGWPAGPGRFGMGLHLELMASLGDRDRGFIGLWGAKLQLPRNPILDIALGADMWGYFPGEIKLHVSRVIGPLEPYACLAAVTVITEDNDGQDQTGDGIFSITAGIAARLGSGSPWSLAAEVEGGSAWDSPGAGAGLFRSWP
jgi:hypothetical protein